MPIAKTQILKNVSILWEIYLGGEFRSKTEEIMAARVREPFEKDNKGHMQIGRFHRLRDHYVMESRSLVAEYFESFKGRITSMFNIFEELVWMTGMFEVELILWTYKVYLASHTLFFVLVKLQKASPKLTT